MSHLTDARELLEKETSLPETSPVRSRLIRYAALLDNYEIDARTPESIWDRDFRSAVGQLLPGVHELSDDALFAVAAGIADGMARIRRERRELAL